MKGLQFGGESLGARRAERLLEDRIALSHRYRALDT